MRCKRCGKPLPNNGVACKFCGMLMNQEQLNYQRKMAIKEDKRLQMLTEKYANNKTSEYSQPKENKLLGLIIIVIVLLILITLAIIINVMN